MEPTHSTQLYSQSIQLSLSHLLPDSHVYVCYMCYPALLDNTAQEFRKDQLPFRSLLNMRKGVRPSTSPVRSGGITTPMTPDSP